MQAEFFDHNAHYAEMVDWYRKRNQEAPSLKRLPINGFIVPGVACAFFFQTETESAIFEYCAANPEASKDDQYKAIEIITRLCFKRARELGYKHFMCLTPIPGIVEFTKRIPGATQTARGTDTFLQVELTDGTETF